MPLALTKPVWFEDLLDGADCKVQSQSLGGQWYKCLWKDTVAVKI